MGAKGMTKYYADYDSLEETLSAAEQLTEDTAAEGDVLLKNQNKALPMRGNEWISVFGVSADSLIGAASRPHRPAETRSRMFWRMRDLR